VAADDNHSLESSYNSVDEPIVELLERERRQWQSERERLIQCIHLQQLELTQRSMAAHDRAVDIAQEFAKAIEMFEDRLLAVETNVQRELRSMREVVESTVALQQQQILHQLMLLNASPSAPVPSSSSSAPAVSKIHGHSGN
jgi:hypothetical protein